MAQRRLYLCICLLFAAFVLAGALRAAPSFPALSGRIVDEAGLLDLAAKARIEAKLADLEAKTTNQVVVVTLRSLQGYDIADYGYQLGRQWGIGQAGKDNGAMLIVAPAERKVRIEVGYGLEGTLTDAVSRLIIDNAILPRFRAGDFSGGIERGTDDIVQVLSGGAEDFKARAAERASRPRGGEGLSTFTVVLILLAIWLVIFLRRSRQQPLARSRRSGWWGPASGGGWSGGGWSRGGGGGSGGGFSGGGGSFGGGGSSGSW